MALPQPSGQGLLGSNSKAPASNSTLQRRIPCFKLSDDERARSKSFRSPVPNAGSCSGAGTGDGEGPMPTPVFDGTPAPGPRRVPSFALASDVFLMPHTSSWGSGAGSNSFDFGPASVDGEGEYTVQRLDDASFIDLTFFAMEGVGSSDLSGTAQREPSGDGLDTKSNEKSTTADGRGSDRYSTGSGDVHEGYSGGHLQPTVSKEGIGVSPIIDRTGSAHDILRRANSARDVLRPGSFSRKDSDRDFLGGNVLDLEGGLPTFSASMEEFLNRQLEAAEQSLDSSGDEERAFGYMASGCDGGPSAGSGGSGSGGDVQLAHMGVAGGVTSAPILAPARSVVAKSELNYSVGDVTCTRHGRGIQRQKQQQQRDSDEDADSSASEYEPPPSRGRKAKKGRGRGRGHAATATRTAKVCSGRSGAPAASASSSSFRRGSLKRQSSEDVAARLPIEVLEHFYHVPLNVAARQLDVSLTMLKKLCRAYGVKRWPHRQVSSLDKTTLKLEEKIKARTHGGKDAPSLVRKLTQARKRRKVIIKTASAGLDANVLNSIFTCRPGDIDEDLLLSSTDVAKAVEKIQSALEVDHKGSGAESESDAEDNNYCRERESDDDNDVKCDPAVKLPLTVAERTANIRAILRTPSFSSTPPAIGKSVAAPPPAFEPGGPAKGIATIRASDQGDGKAKSCETTVGNLASEKPGKKIGRPASSVRRTKGRKGGAMAASRSVPLAGRRASALVRKGAVTASVSPASCTSSVSVLDNSAGSSSVDPMAAGSAWSPTSPIFSVGRSPRNRAPTAGYSGVFGMGLHHNPSGMSNRGGGPTAFAGLGDLGGSSGGTPPTTQPRVGECAYIYQAARAPAWIGGGGKRAIGYGEWRGDASNLHPASLQQHLSDPGSESPTTTTTLDSFDLKLSLESPPRGPFQASPPLPPPPPPFLLHHQLLHQNQHHPSFHHLNRTTGGRFPPQQPYGFAIDTCFPPPQHGPGSRGFHAFSKVDDSEDAGISAPCSSHGEEVTNGNSMHAASATAAAAESTSQEAEPRRTGFMSYLLYHSPRSPPLGTSAPVPPGALGALAGASASGS